MLMRKFFSTCENCVSLDMVPEVIGVQAKFGAVDAGQLQYAAKLLNVSRLPMPGPVERLLNLENGSTPNGHPSPEGMEQPPDPEEFTPPRPRLPIPGPVKGLMNGGLRLMDEALGDVFAASPKVVPVQHFDDSFDAFFERVASGVSCVVEKDAAFLRWRYGPGSPQCRVTVLAVREAGGLAGYAVVRTVSGGQDGYVFDLVALPGRRDVARALLWESVRLLREEGAHIIRYRFSDSPTGPRSGDLLRLGFFHRNDRRNTLMTKFADEAQHERATSVDRWSYNIGDGEASFWLR
jgi:hypothetical protein